MPDPRQLQVGDRVRIVGVPKHDVIALESGCDYLDDTVKVLRWMVGREFVVCDIDEFRAPWVDVVGYPDPDGATHTMAIMDSDSWEPASFSN